MNHAPHILVVDDNPLALRALSRILRAANYTVIEAANGEECLRLAREHMPDLILLDVVMDEPSGIEICRRIKADPALAHSFVILFSSIKTDSDDQAIGIEAGADGYITRPISNRELVARVQAMLRLKAAEDALRASETRYRTLVETADDVILLTDLNGKHLFRNPAYYTSLGYAVGEDLPLNGYASVHPDDAPILRGKMNELLERGSLTSEYRVRHKDGRWIHRFAKSKLIYDKAGNPQAILAIIRDITEHKRAEEELRALSARHQAILAAAPDIIMEMDNNKVYTWANKAGYAFFGADVIGKPADFYFEGEQNTYNIVQPLFNGRSEDVIYVESWQRRQDGAKRLLAWWCRTLKDPHGNVIGALSTARDITEQKRAQDMLQEYSQHLEQMVKARTRELRAAQEQLLQQERLMLLGQIAGSIGHELRGPLGAISNAAYLLRQILSAPDADTREALDILTRQVEASNRIITSLLSFTRPQPPLRRSTDVRAILDTALAQVTLPDNVIVQRELADALPTLQADSEQLQILLSNLIRNAAQAMPDGGTLTISAQRSAGGSQPSAIEIRVADTGTGISPEIRDKIFHPMFTTKSRGLGLGLPLCKLIVEAHGGTITVDSTVGKGTMFTVMLPAE